MTNRLPPLLMLGCAMIAHSQVPVIKPVPGLVLTVTAFSQLLTNAHTSANYIYSENYISLQAVAADQLTYTFQLAVPTDQALDSDVNKLRFTRKVWREDIENAERMTVGYSSRDPEIYDGQTFAETSRRVITALKTSGESAFVLGGYSTAGRTGTGNVTLQSLMDSSRAYYHGTLHRVEANGVALPVLVNGKRFNLPAVHASGTFSLGGDAQSFPAELWWLDNPDYPLTLKYIFGRGSMLVTRIDFPDGVPLLAGKACRAELYGLYFNSGSAQLLSESDPMLRQIAGAVRASADASLTLEGHTDNIGTAQQNQVLSGQRADAVRKALVTRFGVPRSRLSVRSFGMTRPIESNDTVEGRARNRRVELVRPCGDRP